MDLILHLKEILKHEEALSQFTEIERGSLDKVPVGGWEYIQQLCDMPWVSHDYRILKLQTIVDYALLV
jgi:hypothetical protein